MSSAETGPSPEEIEAARTPAGGWTRAQLAQWGVPWPPPEGWRQRLIAQWKEREAATGGVDQRPITRPDAL